MTETRTAWKDDAGEAEPWIELFNAGAGDVDLGGAFLSDDPAQRRKWTFPAGTIIKRHAQLLVAADGQPAQGPLHASFRLAPGAGRVILTFVGGGSDGERAYPAVAADQSLVFSHETDGFVPAATPTPGTGGF
jgi:hypothetical protein